MGPMPQTCQSTQSILAFQLDNWLRIHQLALVMCVFYILVGYSSNHWLLMDWLRLSGPWCLVQPLERGHSRLLVNCTVSQKFQTSWPQSRQKVWLTYVPSRSFSSYLSSRDGEDLSSFFKRLVLFLLDSLSLSRFPKKGILIPLCLVCGASQQTMTLFFSTVSFCLYQGFTWIRIFFVNTSLSHIIFCHFSVCSNGLIAVNQLLEVKTICNQKEKEISFEQTKHMTFKYKLH